MNLMLLASLFAAMNLVYDPARPEICNGEVITPSGNGSGCLGQTALPVALLIHGGGWTAMDKKDVVGIAEFLANDLGYAVYNINYRLAGKENPWPACGEDCLKAGEFVFSDEFAAKTGLKPKSILVIGGSAGGHLALWTVSNSARSATASFPSQASPIRKWTIRRIRECIADFSERIR